MVKCSQVLTKTYAETIVSDKEGTLSADLGSPPPVKRRFMNEIKLNLA